jgi:hypothetical protein
MRRIDRLGRAAGFLAQRVAQRTSHGPLRPLWAASYWLIFHAAAAYFRRIQPGAAVYLRGSLADGEPLYGSADVDLSIIVPPESAGPGIARRRAVERWRAVIQRVPALDSIVHIKVFEAGELERAASTTVFTEDGRTAPLTGAWLFRIRPGLAPPSSDWRRIAGPELRPGDPASPEPHLTAWLELQWWWRLCLDACLSPERPHVPYLCLKLITQSARVRLWLEDGEAPSGHSAVLERALVLMPEEGPALHSAERLLRELPRSPDPPLAEAIGFLLRTTAHVAATIADRSRASGHTVVRLLGANTRADDLALAPEARQQLSAVQSDQVIPLADWRARTSHPLLRRDRVDPPLADEVLALVAGDPGNPEELRRLAKLSESGLRPALRWGPVMVLPHANYSSWLHRSVQFECSDPVTYAQLSGQESAAFPLLSGWSASDCARRAVEAHAFWLEHFPSIEPGEAGVALGLLLASARAALFRDSILGGEPELAVSASATANRLAAEHDGSAALLEEALGSYRAWRDGGPQPGLGTASALRELIVDLPAYRPTDQGMGPPPVALPRGAIAGR